MASIHHHLKQKSSWYRFWHDEPHHQKMHWLVFVLFSTLVGLLVLANVTGNRLNPSYSGAASDTVTLFPGETKTIGDLSITYGIARTKGLFWFGSKPSFTFSSKDRSVTVQLSFGNSASLFDNEVQVTFLRQSKGNSATLEIHTAAIVPPPQESYIEKGWDPGMKLRRIATINANRTGYYENCPDGIVGKCYPAITAGSGFYTLSPSMNEGDNVPCKVNSGEQFRVPGAAYGEPEPCPFYFDWSIDAANRVTAVLTDDTRNWSRSDTPNIYLGFQQNTPFGGLYMGANNMPNINEAYFEAYMQGSLEGVRTQEGAFGRFMTGVGWYVPSLQKSFVVEFNLDSFNTTQPQLSTTLEAVDNPSCGDAVKCTYLGARFWGIDSIIGSTPKKVSIDWAATVQKLIQKGYLPAEAYGSYPVSVFHSGPEMFGRGKLVDRISGATIKAKVR